MSKKHSTSSQKSRRLNDPDFAGKKAVKNVSMGEKKADKADNSAAKPKEQAQAATKGKHSASAAVSAKSLHNKDSKKPAPDKKTSTSNAKAAEKSKGEKIEVKTTKNNSPKQSPQKTSVDARKSAPKSRGSSSKKYKPDIVAPPKSVRTVPKAKVTPKTKPVLKTTIDKQIPTTKKSPAKPTQNAPKKFNWRKTWRKHPMPAILRIPCAIFLLAGAAILFTWFIFWRVNSCDADLVAEFIGEKPMLFSYSCLIIFFLMAIAAAITWHLFFTIGLSFSLASIITFISVQKFNLREEPLLPGDFVFADQAGNLMGMVDAGALWRLISGVVLVMTGSILLEIYTCKMLGKHTRGRPWWERYSILPRLAYGSIALAGFTMTALPIIRHEIPEWLEGYTKVAWNQTATYGKNGFVLDFVSNIRRTTASKPHDYSSETIMKIAEKYWAIKEADAENRKPLNEIADRIFIVLDESFYDPEIIRNYYDYGNKEVLPATHEIFKNYPSGFMYSPGYGGGTANIEFEVQTGYSNHWANAYPYIEVVSNSNSIQSVANWAKNYGFNTGAVHSYWGNMYSRKTAYPTLGYDEFIDWDAMSVLWTEPGTPWPNDSATLDEALNLAERKTPSLINVVTMQNHTGFSTNTYAHYDFPVTGTKRDDELTQYFQLLHASDAYLGEWLEELEQSKQKTVVLWFGDHATGLFDELAESDDKSERDLTRLTPYFIWANFDLKSDSKQAILEVAEKNKELGFDLSMIKGVDLPTTTPNCLLNQLYNTLGAEKPALYYLLDTVCEEAPIITGNYYESQEDFPDTEAVKEYELVNYDIMNGQQYWDGE